MPEPSALTDRESSLSASEFIWDGADHSEAHDYLAGPVLDALRAHGASTVLDLGCGNGSFTRRLSQEGFMAAGLDASESGISQARAFTDNMDLEVHDLGDDLPARYRNRYDAVVAMEVIEHLLLPRRVFATALPALRNGGLLIVTTPFHGYLKNLAIALTNGFDKHWHPLRDYGHVKFFSKRTLLNLFNEFPLSNVHFGTAGRLPLLAKSMIVSATKRSPGPS